MVKVLCSRFPLIPMLRETIQTRLGLRAML